HLHDDAKNRLAGASTPAYVDALSVQWMNQSVKDAHFDAAIHVRVLHHDLSVLGFEVKGPDGDKLAEHLAGQAGGIDLWGLQVPREIAVYERDGEYPVCWVHVDATNRMINLPAEQNGPYKEVYGRLEAQGHLVAHHQ